MADWPGKKCFYFHLCRKKYCYQSILLLIPFLVVLIGIEPGFPAVM